MKTPTAALWIILIIAIIVFAVFVMWGSTKDLFLFVPTYTLHTTQTNEDATAESPYVPQKIKVKDYFVTVVNYTGSRFVPQVVTINRGDTVRFINKDNLSMRITSQGLDHVSVYPGFEQQNSVGTGGKYDFVFNTPGVWAYHNLNGDPGIVGVIYVMSKP